LSEEEFWELTPKEYSALVERYNNEHEWQNFRAALIASTIANISRDKKKHRKPFTPQDFMPGAKRKKRASTWQQQLRLVELLNVAFGGVDKRKRGRRK